MRHAENLKDIILELKNVRERLGGRCPVMFLSVVDDRDPIFEIEPEVNLITSPYENKINSWRGMYNELALGMNPNEHSDVPGYIRKIISNSDLNGGDGIATIDKLINLFEDANGATFFGYKGGEFIMSDNTKVYLDEYGYASSPSISIAFIGSYDLGGLDGFDIGEVCVVYCVNDTINFESNSEQVESFGRDYLNEKVKSMSVGKSYLKSNTSTYSGSVIELPGLKDIIGVNPEMMYHIEIKYAEEKDGHNYTATSYGEFSLGDKVLFDTREKDVGVNMGYDLVSENDVDNDNGRSQVNSEIYDKTVKSLIRYFKNGLLHEKDIDIKKNKVLHHLSHIDLDGYGCQYVSTLYKNNDEQILYYNSNYGGEIQKKLQDIVTNILLLEDKEHTVLITDLNLSQSQAQFIDEKSKEYGFKVILLDHHVSGKDVASLYNWYTLDTTKSGTLLTMGFFEELYEMKIDDSIVQIINSYDLWKTDNELFKYGKSISFVINYIDKLFPRNDSAFTKVHDEVVRRLILSLSDQPRFINDDRFNQGRCYEFGVVGVFDSLRHALENTCRCLYNNSNTDFYCLDIDGLVEYLYAYCLHPRKIEYSNGQRNTSFYIKDSNGNDVQGIVVCSPVHVSSGTMNLLLREYGLLVVAVCYDSGSVSLRSRGDFDVSEVAKELGGGGHRHAAGCFLSDVINEFNEISPRDRNLKTYFEIVQKSKLVKVLEKMCNHKALKFKNLSTGINEI